jgi:threonine-phosphate decarboxylase
MGLNPHGGDHKKPHGSILDFSVNIHSLGYPKELNQVIEREMDHLPYYPSIDGNEAAACIADRLGLDSGQVIVGNGAVELIYLYARLHANRHVCIIGPTFNEYQRAFEKVGAKISHFLLQEEDDFAFSPSRFQKFLDRHPDCKTLVVCHPNNPTGTGITDIESFMSMTRGFDLLVDESFLDFTDLPSFLPWMEETKMFILRSMTKFYALAGLRVGYGIGSKAMIQSLMDEKEPWTMNAFALASIPALLDAKEYQNNVKKWVDKNKGIFYQLLVQEEDWKVYAGKANFLLVKFPFSLLPIREKLLKEGIYFRICTDFESLGDRYGRFTIREEQASLKLIKKIKEAYDER